MRKSKFELFSILILLLTIISACENDTTNPKNVNKDFVTIGKQIWMNRNLDVVTYRNGDTIPQVTDDIEWGSLKTSA